jgi:hypothetical protein
VFKTKSVKQQQIILLEISLGRRDKFSNAIGSTQKAGRLVQNIIKLSKLVLVSGKWQDILNK